MGRETFTGDVAFEVRGHLGIITLNRPKALNSLTGLMCESIRVQLEDWADDAAVVQVLIRGAGDRGLCAGGDVASVYREMIEL
jgi:enoyl-CoA hydratase